MKKLFKKVNFIKLNNILVWVLIAFLSVTSCKKEEDEPKSGNEVITLQVPPGFPYPNIPADNQLTRNRIELGKKLFSDPILSQNNSVSCASCHREDNFFIDGFRVSTGINGHVGTRNAPTILNSAYLPVVMWDGSHATLEDQVEAVIENTKEMGSDINLIIAKLNAHPDYPALFNAAYNEPVSVSTLTRAVAAFERSLLSTSTRFDDYSHGNSSALTASELNGKNIFFGKANCSQCHNGTFFTNFAFENNGLYAVYADSGRAIVTGNASDLGKFRIPSLRNIGNTAPYMHDGKKNTLEDVVNHYNSGGASHPNKSSIIQPLNLTAQEKTDLVNFLKSLNNK